MCVCVCADWIRVYNPWHFWEKISLALCLCGEYRVLKLWCVTLWPAHPNYCLLLTSHMSRNVCLMPACSQGTRVMHQGKAQNIGLVPCVYSRLKRIITFHKERRNQQTSTASPSNIHTPPAEQTVINGFMTQVMSPCQNTVGDNIVLLHYNHHNP